MDQSSRMELLVKRVEQAISSLPKNEELTIRLRFGLNGEIECTYREIAQAIGYSVSSVRRFERQALRRLRSATPNHSSHLESPNKNIEITPVIDKVQALTPELIQHLKCHSEDIELIHWEVFQHLVAEFLSYRGFDDVRVVGRNSRTSADIFASHYISPAGIKLKVFVEVKRTNKAVGISVINEVAGAMLTERDTFGWHAAMIVSVAGFQHPVKFSPYHLSLKGIELKDKNDLLSWLGEYKLNGRGLWLKFAGCRHILAQCRKNHHGISVF